MYLRGIRRSWLQLGFDYCPSGISELHMKSLSCISTCQSVLLLPHCATASIGGPSAENLHDRHTLKRFLMVPSIAFSKCNMHIHFISTSLIFLLLPGIMTTLPSAQNVKPTMQVAFGQTPLQKALSLEFINNSFQTVLQKRFTGKIHQMRFS